MLHRDLNAWTYLKGIVLTACITTSRCSWTGIAVVSSVMRTFKKIHGRRVLALESLHASQYRQSALSEAVCDPQKNTINPTRMLTAAHPYPWTWARKIERIVGHTWRGQRGSSVPTYSTASIRMRLDDLWITRTRFEPSRTWWPTCPTGYILYPS